MKTSKPAAKTAARTHSLASLDGVQLAATLAANRETLVTNNMVEKGHPRPEAELEIDAMTAIARLLGRATLTGGVRGGLAWIELGISLNLP